jgi:hypothetical protein
MEKLLTIEEKPDCEDHSGHGTNDQRELLMASDARGCVVWAGNPAH